MGEQPPEYQQYQPGYGPPPAGPPPPPGYPQAGPPVAYGFNPAAPYGVDPVTGAAYSDKIKLVAGLLQILIPVGIGRFYMGHTGLGVAQLVVSIVTCGFGMIWPLIDGIVILVGNPRDAHGRPMKMS